MTPEEEAAARRAIVLRGMTPAVREFFARLDAAAPATPAPTPRCMRRRSTGQPCGARAITYDISSAWLNDAGTCGHHLTPAERERREADRAARDEANDLALDVPPHCWLWPRSAAVDVEHPAQALADWQSGRCAICGRETWLVEDHDHATGLVRGLLCQRHNVREGTHPDDGPHVYAYYRRRPPTTILGVSYHYVSIVTLPDGPGRG